MNKSLIRLLFILQSCSHLIGSVQSEFELEADQKQNLTLYESYQDDQEPLIEPKCNNYSALGLGGVVCLAIGVCLYKKFVSPNALNENVKPATALSPRQTPVEEQPKLSPEQKLKNVKNNFKNCLNKYFPVTDGWRLSINGKTLEPGKDTYPYILGSTRTDAFQIKWVGIDSRTKSLFETFNIKYIENSDSNTRLKNIKMLSVTIFEEHVAQQIAASVGEKNFNITEESIEKLSWALICDLMTVELKKEVIKGVLEKFYTDAIGTTLAVKF